MKKLTVGFTRKELIFGWIYMLLQLFALPMGLSWGNGFLKDPLSEAELNFCYFALNFLFTTIIFRKYLLGNVKLFFRRFFRNIGITLLALVIYWVLFIAVGMLILYIYPEFNNVNDAAMDELISENFTLMAIGAVILAPVTEEVLFRGLLFRGIYNKSRFLAYVVSAAAFSLPHVIGYLGQYSPFHLLLCFVQYLPAGFCLGWAYAKSDSICLPILMHMSINLVGVWAMR